LISEAQQTKGAAMNRILSVTLSAALLSGVCMSRADAAGGLYIGAGVGQASIKESAGGTTFDASDAAYKAFVGYRFNLIPIIDLAVEGGYTDFGKPSQDIGGQNVQIKLHGPSAAGLLIFPLGPIDLYGKAGVLSWKADVTPSGTGSSTSGSDPFYGVGVGFYIWKIGIRAEYEKYNIKDTDRVQMYSVSALFQF
jgi:outer membrane immunogenic protein